MAKKKAEKQAEYNKILDLCVDIFAHCQLDIEITLCGNGTNCAEAANVADAVLEALGKKADELEPEIAKRAAELKKLHDIDDIPF